MPPERQALPLAPAPTALPPGEALPSRPDEVVGFWSRYRWWLIGLIAAGLLTAGIFTARPALHAVKAWQARRISGQAEKFIDRSEWPAAREKVQDALALWSQEPAAMHAAARFLTRVGAMRDAAHYWKNLAAVRSLSTGDERDYASAAFALGDLGTAEARLRRAWPEGKPGAPEDWTLAMQMAARRNRPAEAADLARRLLDDKASTERQRFNAAVVLGTSPVPGNEARGWEILRGLATGGSSPESLEALVILARQSAAAALSTPPQKAASPIALPELIDQIEHHPQAKIQYQLLALDLRIAREPARRAEFIQNAVDRFAATKDDTELSALAGWLYGKTEYARALAILPLDRAVEEKTLFLQHLDILAALGRWDEVQELIRSQKFPLDDLTAEMYQARCAAQLNQLPSRDAHWAAALDAAGTQADKLMLLGGYAEKSGALDTAEGAYRAASQALPEAHEPREGLIRVLSARKDTARLRTTVAEMLALRPADLALQNDSAYLDALANENVPAARETARRLMHDEPANLAHRAALALAELRLGHALSALDAFAGLNLANTALPPGTQAIYATTLWQTNYEREARELAKRIPVDQLLPEERALVAPVLDGAAK